MFCQLCAYEERQNPNLPFESDRHSPRLSGIWLGHQAHKSIFGIHERDLSVSDNGQILKRSGVQVDEQATQLEIGQSRKNDGQSCRWEKYGQGQKEEWRIP